jgi:hypothetical protein
MLLIPNQNGSKGSNQRLSPSQECPTPLFEPWASRKTGKLMGFGIIKFLLITLMTPSSTDVASFTDKRLSQAAAP